MAFLPYLCGAAARGTTSEREDDGRRGLAFHSIHIFFTRNHILQDMVTQDQLKDLSGRELALRRYL